MRPLDPERVERPPEERRVRLDRMAEAVRAGRAGRSRAGRTPRRAHARPLPPAAAPTRRSGRGSRGGTQRPRRPRPALPRAGWWWCRRPGATPADAGGRAVHASAAGRAAPGVRWRAATRGPAPSRIPITETNAPATSGSRWATARNRRRYALTARTRSGRGPATAGRARSAPVVSVHAWSTGARAAAKKRRARSCSPSTRQSRSASASAAATVMPLPVDRIERAQGVPAYEQSGREARHPVVAPPHARGVDVGDDGSDRRGRTERLAHVRRSDRGREGVEAGGVGGGSVLRPVAGDREDEPIVLLGEQEQRARQVGPGSDQHELVAVERAWREPQVPARVRDVHREPLLGGRREAERRQPRRHARAAPGRAHDQVGRQRLGAAAVRAPEDPHAGHAVAVPDEPERVAAVEQAHVLVLAHPPPDVTLDQRPAGDDPAQPERGTGEPPARRARTAGPPSLGMSARPPRRSRRRSPGAAPRCSPARAASASARGGPAAPPAARHSPPAGCRGRPP